MIDRRYLLPSLTRAAVVASLLALAVNLGGCAGVGDSFASGAFVDPAKYNLYDCKQLETERKALAARTAELQGLIDKAQTGTAGSVVGELAYRNDYISARASAKLAGASAQGRAQALQQRDRLGCRGLAPACSASQLPVVDPVLPRLQLCCAQCLHGQVAGQRHRSAQVIDLSGLPRRALNPSDA
jgi:hypothetical protein